MELARNLRIRGYEVVFGKLAGDEAAKRSPRAETTS